jgi:RNA polymerase sigma factor (sigma-70 family)
VSPTDAELVATVLADGSHAAYGELVRRHQSAVRKFLRHLLRGDAASADDLAQETFVRAYRALPRFKHGSAFSTWLLGIAHNQCRNARRAQAVAPTMPLLDADHRVDAQTNESDLRHDLAIALRELDPNEQLAVHLHYEQGLSHSEIAALLAWPLGTVKTHLLRGKEKLRPLLAAWNPQT